MISLKTLLFGTTLAAGTALFMGTTAYAGEAYTIQSNDTLSTISQKYVGDSSLISVIAESNSVSDINLIYPGQQLTIPTEGSIQAVAEPQATVQGAPTQVEPVQTEQPVVQETVQTEAQVAPVAEAQSATTEATATSANAAKERITQKESSGSYTTTDGRYIGRYRLDSSYLNGDYSAANQKEVAEQYVASRYGSWGAARAFWEANGWY